MRYLSSLGYGTRREVKRLLASGAVTDAGGRPLQKDESVSGGDEPEGAPGGVSGPPHGANASGVTGGPPGTRTLRAEPRGHVSLTHAQIRVRGERLDPPPGSVVLLHKPVGVVCSTTDPNPVVYDLLPPRFRLRSPIMASVGRLDRDTTGVLLLTDDGALLHRLTSPKSHLPKCYRVTLTETFRASDSAALTSGTLLLDGEHKPVAPALLAQSSERELHLTITEGRYHQVRRMLAAVGYHVASLHRASVGPITLGTLPTGEWRVLRLDERDTLQQAIAHARQKSPGDSVDANVPRAIDESPPAP